MRGKGDVRTEIVVAVREDRTYGIIRCIGRAAQHVGGGGRPVVYLRIEYGSASSKMSSSPART